MVGTGGGGTKRWIGAGELLLDSLRLAGQVRESGFVPQAMVALWRGGAPVALAMHEAFAWHGIEMPLVPLATRLYTGIDERAARLRIEGIESVAARLAGCERMLVVDDVFDSGRTIEGVLDALAALPGAPRAPRTATVWWKPARNTTRLRPDYHLHETADWLVFPHELLGLSAGEIRKGRGAEFAAALGAVS